MSQLLVQLLVRNEVANRATTAINLCQQGVHLVDCLCQLLATLLLVQSLGERVDVGDDTLQLLAICVECSAEAIDVADDVRLLQICHHSVEARNGLCQIFRVVVNKIIHALDCLVEVVEQYRHTLLDVAQLVSQGVEHIERYASLDGVATLQILLVFAHLNLDRLATHQTCAEHHRTRVGWNVELLVDGELYIYTTLFEVDFNTCNLTNFHSVDYHCGCILQTVNLLVVSGVGATATKHIKSTQKADTRPSAKQYYYRINSNFYLFSHLL